MIELVSDLGGGKTTFVQGLAEGFGYRGAVTSPTFTLSQIYPVTPSLELHHYDLYRLTEGGVLGEELLEDAGADHVVTVIEWPGLIEASLPDDRLLIEIELTADDERSLRFRGLGPSSLALVKELAS